MIRIIFPFSRGMRRAKNLEQLCSESEKCFQLKILFRCQYTHIDMLYPSTGNANAKQKLFLRRSTKKATL